MTALDILSPELKQQYEALNDFLQRSLWLAEKCADFETTQILRARLTNLNSAALLVVVGEVKAGKSSLINALVREEVCDVAPGPCTTGIQELLYGEQRDVISLGQHWERVYLPKEVLREITIVDTPGTNSIVRNHQTITENYIPQSDLVVFVFSATNPHTNSAWELLTLIRKEWHRKMVFVLQQADRASEKELTINQEHVKQYARERHVEDPIVFTLSAKREIEGAPDSGFAEFRTFLRNAIEHGEAWRTKVEGSYQTIRAVVTKLLSHLRVEQAVVAEERAFYQELLRQVEVREVKAHSLKQLIVGTLSGIYDRFTRRLEHEFALDLAVGKILRRSVPLLRDKSIKAWLEDLKVRFEMAARKEIEIGMPQMASDLSAELQTMMDELIKSVAQRQWRSRESAPFPKIADRAETLAQLKSKLESLPVDEVISVQAGKISDVANLALAGGGLAVLGTVLVVISQNALLDITGGIFAGIGVFLVAVGLFWKRRAIVRNFRQKLGHSRKEFRDRLDFEINQMFHQIFHDVRHAINEPLGRLHSEAARIAPLLEETFQVGETAAETLWLSKKISVMQPLTSDATIDQADADRTQSRLASQS